MGKITTKKRILFSFRGQVTINGQIMSEKPGIFCAQNGQKLWVFGQPVGGIFDQPTIFNTPAGMQGVGEKGPEAILPLDTLWAKMKEILNEAIAASSGASLIDTFVGKLNGIGTGGVRNIQEIDGDDGLHVQYSPVYNLYGSTTKQEVIEAERISQAEFDKRMKQYERDRQRRRL